MAFDTPDTDADLLPALREPSHYRTTVPIPPKWLNAGSYYVIVGIADLSYKIRYDRIQLSTFSVLDVGVPEKGEEYCYL